MKVRVYIRVKTITVVLAKKDMRIKEMAERMEVNYDHLRAVLSGREPAGPELRKKIMDELRGASHKRGGRLTWDDVFCPALVDSGASL